MNRRKISTLVVLLVIWFSIGSGRGGTIVPSPGPPPEGNSAFAIEFFKACQNDHPNENLLVSPLSADLALKMARNGAGGETLKDMSRVLGLNPDDLAGSNQRSEEMIRSLEAVAPLTELDIADSIWVDKRVTFKSDFLEVNQKFYRATLETVDFSNPKTPDLINRWVNDKTQGKIPIIIDQMNPEEVLVLINAVYFKGSWLNRFETTDTSPEPFYLPDGTQVKVPMMHQNKTGQLHKYLHLQNPFFEAVQLPYQDKRLGLVLFLPSKTSSLTQFCGALTSDSWNEWMSKPWYSSEIMLSLPKFKIENSLDLKSPLTQLGMGIIFGAGSANFTGIRSSGKLYVSKAVQKTFMEVNEEGTEAAAATSLEYSFYGFDDGPYVLKFDRPFFFALYDQKTKTVLFAGTVNNPNQ